MLSRTTALAIVATALLISTPTRAADVVVAIVAPTSDVQNTSSADLATIFLGKRKTWPSGDKVIPINLPAKTPTRILFDQAVLEMSPAEAGRYWVGQRIRARARPPKSVRSAELVKKLVASIPGTVGYIPVSLLDSSVRALTINGVAHTAPTYPIRRE